MRGPTGSAGTPPSFEQLVMASAFDWVPVSQSSDDPFFPEEDVNANYDCPDSAYGVEGNVFEVETGECSYATFTQPSKLRVKADQPIEFLVWHLNLWAPEAATAHVAIRIGDEMLWETNVGIPGAADVYSETPSLSSDVEAGTPMYIHLHNHGVNSWRFGDIEAIGEPVL